MIFFLNGRNRTSHRLGLSTSSVGGEKKGGGAHRTGAGPAASRGTAGSSTGPWPARSARTRGRGLRCTRLARRRRAQRPDCQADQSAVSDGGDDQGGEAEALMGCMPRENRFRQFWKPVAERSGSAFQRTSISRSLLSRLFGGCECLYAGLQMACTTRQTVREKCAGGEGRRAEGGGRRAGAPTHHLRRLAACELSLQSHGRGLLAACRARLGVLRGQHANALVPAPTTDERATGGGGLGFLS